jgi:hypothetical protein
MWNNAHEQETQRSSRIPPFLTNWHLALGTAAVFSQKHHNFIRLSLHSNLLQNAASCCLQFWSSSFLFFSLRTVLFVRSGKEAARKEEEEEENQAEMQKEKAASGGRHQRRFLPAHSSGACPSFPSHPGLASATSTTSQE